MPKLHRGGVGRIINIVGNFITKRTYLRIENVEFTNRMSIQCPAYEEFNALSVNFFDPGTCEKEDRFAKFRFFFCKFLFQPRSGYAASVSGGSYNSLISNSSSVQKLVSSFFCS